MIAMPKKMKKILTILSLVLVMSITLFSLGLLTRGGVRGIGLIRDHVLLYLRDHCGPGSIDSSGYPLLLFYRSCDLSKKKV
jgi:hypothetical protein